MSSDSRVRLVRMSSSAMLASERRAASCTSEYRRSSYSAPRSKGAPGSLNPELDDDAHADGDLIRGQDLLTVDRQLALAHVDEHDLHPRAAAEQLCAARNDVAAGVQDANQHAVLVPEATVRVLDEDL